VRAGWDTGSREDLREWMGFYVLPALASEEEWDKYVAEFVRCLRLP